jgi:apolipoprotein N-acyltransferase
VPEPAADLEEPTADESALRRRDPWAGAAAVGAGALVAAALPPWGWWPLAFVGIAILDRLLAGRPWRSRLARTWLFGLAWLLPGMGWMWFLSAPGWIVACAAYAGYLGVAAALAPSGRWRVLGLASAITLAEALRFVWPFGGVPLASLAIGQADGPLLPIARVGGTLLLTWVVIAAGCGLSQAAAAAWRRLGHGSAAKDDAVGRDWIAPAVGLGATAALLALSAVAPTGHATGAAPVVALVQGGGPQGTRAVDTNPREVFERHLAATRSITGPVDLVVWPENVIDVDQFATSPERSEVAAEAARLGVPVAVGITEDAGPDHYLNAQVVVLPDGSLSDRYDKVERVPFGEYMPLRWLLTRLGAPTDLVPRDAVAGTGPAVLHTDVGPLGVAISWEVFFDARARAAARAGGQVLLNPTNGSSYRGTVLQTQQIASSRLRAVTTGRWVAQVAPTGFSAFVSPAGAVHQRTGVSERAVITTTVPMRTGRTLYVVWGDLPVLLLCAGGLGLSWWLTVKDRRRVTAPAAP